MRSLDLSIGRCRRFLFQRLFYAFDGVQGADFQFAFLSILLNAACRFVAIAVQLMGDADSIPQRQHQWRIGLFALARLADGLHELDGVLGHHFGAHFYRIERTDAFEQGFIVVAVVLAELGIDDWRQDGSGRGVSVFDDSLQALDCRHEAVIMFRGADQCRRFDFLHALGAEFGVLAVFLQGFP